MALTSALFTGLSGLDVNQARLNVVGNNIANVNTIAFKSSRALFKPQFYVTDAGGTPPGAEFGGTNPSQRGLGAVVATIEKDFSTGSIEPTGKPTDLALDGTGFFIVDGANGQKFTRDGSFNLNSSNQLVTSGGEFVQGYAADADGNIQVGQLDRISIPLGTTTTARATENVKLEGNLNANGVVGTGASVLSTQLMTTVGGTVPTGASLLTDLRDTGTGTALFNSGDVLNVNGDKGGRSLAQATLTVGPATTVADLQTFFGGGLGIDTSVTAPGAPPPGVTLETDATDPNSARLFVVGNPGTENALALSGNAVSTSFGGQPLIFSDSTNAAGFASNPTGESVHTSYVGYDSLGTPMTVDITAVLESKADTGNTWRFYASSGDFPAQWDPKLGIHVT